MYFRYVMAWCFVLALLCQIGMAHPELPPIDPKKGASFGQITHDCNSSEEMCAHPELPPIDLKKRVSFVQISHNANLSEETGNPDPSKETRAQFNETRNRLKGLEEEYPGLFSNTARGYKIGRTEKATKRIIGQMQETIERLSQEEIPGSEFPYTIADVEEAKFLRSFYPSEVSQEAIAQFVNAKSKLEQLSKFGGFKEQFSKFCLKEQLRRFSICQTDEAVNFLVIRMQSYINACESEPPCYGEFSYSMADTWRAKHLIDERPEEFKDVAFLPQFINVMRKLNNCDPRFLKENPKYCYVCQTAEGTKRAIRKIQEVLKKRRGELEAAKDQWAMVWDEDKSKWVLWPI